LWRRRALESGRCRVEDLRFPVRARAPGHVPALVTQAGEEVVLEPDALLVIEGKDLRHCLRAVRPLASWTRAGSPAREEYESRIAESLSFGFVDADHWALAATRRELFRLPFSLESVEIDLEWRDRRAGGVAFKALPG